MPEGAFYTSQELDSEIVQGGKAAMNNVFVLFGVSRLDLDSVLNLLPEPVLVGVVFLVVPILMIFGERRRYQQQMILKVDIRSLFNSVRTCRRCRVYGSSVAGTLYNI